VEIREICVHNIRSFEDATLHLGSGTSLLWGDVGAGKTSLLHAIEMALFGFSEVDAAHLIRHRAGTAEVRLTLADGPHEYVFTRRFHRRMRRGRDQFETDEKSTGLATDGVMTRYPATELRQRAIDLLGFPDNPNPRAHSDLWRWAVYVPQERMRQILASEDADARLETVRKALGLERYRTAAENAKLAAQELRREAAERVDRSDLLGHWEPDLRDAELALASAERAVEEASGIERAGRHRVAELERDHAAAEARARQAEADRQGLREAEARRAELEKNREARTARRTEAEARQASIRSEVTRLTAAARQAADLVRRCADAERAVTELADAVERAREGAVQHELALGRATEARARSLERASAHQRATEALERATQGLAGLLREGEPAAPSEDDGRSAEAIERELAQAVSESEQAAGELERWRAAVREAETLLERGICPTCGQKVDPGSLEGHRAERARAFDQAQSRYTKASEERQARTRERQEREARVQGRLRWESFEHRRRSALAEVERARTEAARTEGARETSRRELAEAEEEAGRSAFQASTLRTTQERWKAATADFERLRSEATESERAAQEVRLREESLESLRRELAHLDSEEAADRAKGAELGARIRSLRESLERNRALEEEILQLGRSLGEARGAVEQAVGRVHRGRAEGDAARRRIAEARVRVDERLRLRRTARDLQATGEFLRGDFRDAMLELEHRLLSRAKVEFDRSFGRYFSVLIEDPSLVARTDPQFNPSVDIEGEPTPPEALSGGERTALALAYRLALGDVVRSLDRLNLSTLILDEPTDGFSPEQVQRVGELLSELSLPQVLLVSHEIALTGIADRVVRVRKVAGASQLSEEGAGGEGPPPVALIE
jgi:DNA repair protein SbcC/Rad50